MLEDIKVGQAVKLEFRKINADGHSGPIQYGYKAVRAIVCRSPNRPTLVASLGTQCARRRSFCHRPLQRHLRNADVSDGTFFARNARNLSWGFLCELPWIKLRVEQDGFSPSVSPSLSGPGCEIPNVVVPGDVPGVGPKQSKLLKPVSAWVVFESRERGYYMGDEIVEDVTEMVSSADGSIATLDLELRDDVEDKYVLYVGFDALEIVDTPGTLAVKIGPGYGDYGKQVEGRFSLDRIAIDLTQSPPASPA